MVADNQQFALAPDPQGSLLYQTAPLENDMTLLGFTQMDLFFSSTEPDTDMMVVMHDIDEHGNVTFIQRDYMQASLRKLDPALSTGDERKRCFCAVEKLVPGKVYEARLSIPPVGYVIRKGHRLELGIMSPSQIGTPDWGFVLVDRGGFNTIYSSASYPSKITLATIKTPAVLPPSPACGELEWQPCRKASPDAKP
jgi:predicted acyl esterase